MPVFEYQCEKCRRVASFLVRNLARHKPPACPHCRHPKTRRVLSRFAALSGGRSEEAPSPRPQETGPEPDLSALGDLDEKDPRSLGRMMRRMAEETGEAMPPEMDEMTRRLEAGEDPEKIGAELEGAGDGESGGETLYDA